MQLFIYVGKQNRRLFDFYVKYDTNQVEIEHYEFKNIFFLNFHKKKL